MVRFPHPRLAQLFATLQAETLPQEELARRLAVSTRTVRSDIGALNALLQDHGAQFVLERGEGYRLEIGDAERFDKLRQAAPSSRRLPRTGSERVHCLLWRFLTAAYSLKLQDIADEWFVNRAVLQGDMTEVRDWLARYQLTIETRPHYGMKLLGRESSIRTCLAELLCQLARDQPEHPLLAGDAQPDDDLVTLRSALADYLAASQIRLTDEGMHFLCQYCALACQRLRAGFPLEDFHCDDIAHDIRHLAAHIAQLLCKLSGVALSAAEEAFLAVHISARSVASLKPVTINADDAEALVHYLLDYINTHYNYDLRHDERLAQDLATHVRTMITRVRYQINLPNPVLADIKEHYAMAYDITLAAVSSWARHSPYRISEDEIGYLVLHIGVGLERHYQIGFIYRPQALLVCDSGTSSLRMLEAMLHRRFPQISIADTLSQQEYEALPAIAADFVVSTARLEEKNRPVVVASPFPSDYQLEQLAKMVQPDRSRCAMLERYFNARHFLVAAPDMSQAQLFRTLCEQLQDEGYVDGDYYPSVVEREAILGTMLGDGIALPHSLGLLARRTTVYTVLAPHGIAWGDGNIAHVIFLLAISKDDYEEAMVIYDLFVSLMRERSTARLRECRSFDSFKQVATNCLSRRQGAAG
ncbi:BglG family transcription antiterminator [Chromobacterium amazonense]|uniref:BglG family transcription antiterminator n=1 Tax=Chromobacterium amazonense TaxID=1382803 RepID=UPI003F7B2476